ncbi:hypothetical protein [Arhodomonas sp. AD133]|uniref:hypothetical protein n=1 Tax=Arhodomonas sp. AD133 TaxID=3415009 RepID=UPI003EBDDA45
MRLLRSRRRQSRCLLLFSLSTGLLIGLAAFYWWAERGEGFGAYVVDFVAVRNSLATLLAVSVLGVVYRFCRQRSGAGTAWSFAAGWVLGIVLGPFLFPAPARLLPPPEQVQRAVERWHQVLQAGHAPWEVRIAVPRRSFAFRVDSAPKAIGIMPSRPWMAEWRAHYVDDTRAVARYYVTATQPPRLDSAAITRSQDAGIGFDADDLARTAVSEPEQVPWAWAWALQRPAQPATDAEIVLDTDQRIVIRAHYPGDRLVTWSITRRLDETVERLSFHAPPLPLPCVERWRPLRICITDGNGAD